MHRLEDVPTSQTEVWFAICVLHAPLWVHGVGVLGTHRHASCPQMVTGSLCLAWKAESCPSSLLPPPSSSSPPWCGFMFEALVQVPSGFHCHSGTSFLKPCFLIRSTIFFKCILMPSSLHTLVLSTKNERQGTFSCG